MQGKTRAESEVSPKAMVRFTFQPTSGAATECVKSMSEHHIGVIPWVRRVEDETFVAFITETSARLLVRKALKIVHRSNLRGELKKVCVI